MMKTFSCWLATAALVLAGCGGGGAQPPVSPGLSLFAGSAEEADNVNDSTANATFSNPKGIAIGPAGTVYVSDGTTIRKITADGVLSTIAGSADQYGHEDGMGAAARFTDPQGLAVDSSGTIYVADISIRRVTPDGVVTTLAGTGPPQAWDGVGYTHGVPYRAIGVAIDATGTIYATYSGWPNTVVQKIAPDGAVTTLAGAVGASGSADGTGAAARFWGPSGLAIDGAGTLYVADSYSNTIRKITPDGVVTTLAGMASDGGTSDGIGAAARFMQPNFVAADRSGIVYVADTNNHTIRRITPGAVVTTIVGTVGARGVVLGPLPGGLSYPRALAVGADGVLYVVSGQAILKVQLTS